MLDDERLKQGTAVFGKDYFRELLERVRSIRTSERRIWQQITDIYAECSIDYDKNSPTTHDFYAMIQNRFHYAITGQTAAEIIYTKADHTQEHMGLTTWKNAPDGRILKSDVSIAKNYLLENEIRRLERAVTGYFDYIEDLIERENTFNMEQFAASVNEFLTFRKYRYSMTEDEKLIQEVQDQCEYFAKGIINSLCKRAIRKINSWNIHIGTDDYPSSFNFFNILSIEYQSKCYDEISPCLEDAIEGVLDNEYEKLLPQERFFVDYSQCYYDNEFDSESIKRKIYDRFYEILNEHWESKKIANFEEKRNW